MYKTMEEWLAGNPAEYDFREQILRFAPNEDEFQRHVVYQAIGIAEDDLKEERRGRDASINAAYQEARREYESHEIHAQGEEADSCPLLLKILKELGSESPAADTMNSIQTTLNKMLKIHSKRASKRAMVKQCANDPGPLTDKLEAHGSYARRFLKVAYTVGNFVPCPAGCNRPMTSAIEDYWDLTLWCIYRWYNGEDEEKAEALKTLFGGSDGQSAHRIAYGEWLAKFGTWDDFVEKNYLQDYTEWDQRPYGRPKEFWDGHFEGPALPQTPEQIEAFFTRAAQCIEARSQRMVAALLKKKPQK